MPNQKQQLYLWYGDNDFEIDEQKKTWQNHFKKQYGNINLAIIDFSETGASKENKLLELKNALQVDSLFGMNKLIIAKELFAKRVSKATTEAAQEIIANAWKNLSDTFFIVFLQQGNIDKRNALYKKIAGWGKKGQAQIKEFKLPNGYDINKWIIRRCQQNKISINRDAVEQLTMLVGNDLWQLSAELTKLANFCNDKPIAKEDVNRLITGKFNENIFNLVDSFSNKNAQQASLLVKDQLNAGINHIYILTMLIRQFKILLQIKDLQSQAQIPPNQYASVLRLHPFVAQKSSQQAVNFTLEQLKQIYSLLTQIDIKFKTANANPSLLLNLLIAQISSQA